MSSYTEPVPEGNSDIALLVFTGLVSANLVPTLVCRLPQSHTLTWLQILSLSVRYIALTAVFGVAGITLPWLFLKAKPSFGLAFLSKKVGIGWLFLPCITLLYRQHSPWIFLVVALATVAVAFSLRPIFPAPLETDQAKFAAWKASSLPALYGLPIADFRPLRALIIALLFQGAWVCAVRESLFLASILLAASLFLLAWRWSAFDRTAVKTLARKGPRILLSGVALVLTMLALLPWIAGKSYGPKKAPHKPALITHESAESDQPGSEYVGIILWPPPVKKTEIVPPPPPFCFARNRQGSQTDSHSIRRPILVLQSTQYKARPTCSRRTRTCHLRECSLDQLRASVDGGLSESRHIHRPEMLQRNRRRHHQC